MGCCRLESVWTIMHGKRTVWLLQTRWLYTWDHLILVGSLLMVHPFPKSLALSRLLAETSVREWVCAWRSVSQGVTGVKVSTSPISTTTMHRRMCNSPPNSQITFQLESALVGFQTSLFHRQSLAHVIMREIASGHRMGLSEHSAANCNLKHLG